MSIFGSKHEKCDECGAWIDKINAVEIQNKSFYWLGQQEFRYYCNTHKKPYQCVDYHFGASITYHAVMEVDRFGVPITVKRPVGRPKKV